MCKIADRPEERIFIQETSDPFTSEIELGDTSPEFTQRYLESFRDPLPEDQSKAALQDRLSTGWLAWGKTMEVSRMTGWDEYEFFVDDDCKPGVEQIKPIIESQEFWQTVCGIMTSSASADDVDCRLLGSRGAAQPSVGNSY